MCHEGDHGKLDRCRRCSETREQPEYDQHRADRLDEEHRIGEEDCRLDSAARHTACGESLDRRRKAPLRHRHDFEDAMHQQHAAGREAHDEPAEIAGMQVKRGKRRNNRLRLACRNSTCIRRYCAHALPPKLALTLMDNNTNQRGKFPRRCRMLAAGPGGTFRACWRPASATNRCGERLPARQRASQALLRPHFSYLLLPIRILAAPAAASREAAFVSDLPKTRVVARSAAMRSRFRSLETSLTRRQTMQKGTVKWFNPTKGYGFIRPSSGEKDVFVHISAVERAGLSTLNEGQTVEYELVTNRGKTSAENLKVS